MTAISRLSRRSLVVSVSGVLAGMALTVVATTVSAQSFPARPVTLIVPWGAGGGTDATARIIGSLMEKELGQPITVVNRTGGSGVVGHSAIASAAPDGYTIGMATVEIGMMHWQGLTELNGTSYTPIGLVNADPAGVQVRADSPYKTVNELLAAIKANPGKFKASGTGQGGIWHLAIAGLLRDQKIDPAALPWVPSNGAAPGLQDMIAGGVEVTPVSLPESPMNNMEETGSHQRFAAYSIMPGWGFLCAVVSPLTTTLKYPAMPQRSSSGCVKRADLLVQTPSLRPASRRALRPSNTPS